MKNQLTKICSHDHLQPSPPHEHTSPPQPSSRVFICRPDGSTVAQQQSNSTKLHEKPSTGSAFDSSINGNELTILKDHRHKNQDDAARKVPEAPADTDLSGERRDLLSSKLTFNAGGKIVRSSRISSSSSSSTGTDIRPERNGIRKRAGGRFQAAVSDYESSASLEEKRKGKRASKPYDNQSDESVSC